MRKFSTFINKGKNLLSVQEDYHTAMYEYTKHDEKLCKVFDMN